MLRTRTRNRTKNSKQSFILPSTPTVGVFGNSFASQNWGTITTTSSDRRMQGFATWLGFLTHQNIRVNYAGNYGVSGDALTEFLARRATAIAYNPDIWLLCDIVTNDLVAVSRTTAQITADLDTLVADFAATGKMIIIGNTQPRSVWAALTAPEIAARVIVQQEVRAHINTYKNKYRNVFVADIFDETVDPLSVTKAPLSGYYYDGLHPNPMPGYLMAAKMKRIIDRHVIYNYSQALPSTSGCKNTNPTMSGTSGTVGTGASGTVADSTRVIRTTGSSITAVCSKDTVSIGGNSQTVQKIGVSGATVAGEEVQFQMEFPEAALSFVGGTDNFYAKSRIKIENAIGVSSVYLSCIIDMTTGTDPTTRDMIFISAVNQMLPDGSYEGTMQTEPLAVPSGSRVRDRPWIRVVLNGTVPGNTVTIYVGQTEFRA